MVYRWHESSVFLFALFTFASARSFSTHGSSDAHGSGTANSAPSMHHQTTDASHAYNAHGLQGTAGHHSKSVSDQSLLDGLFPAVDEKEASNETSDSPVSYVYTSNGTENGTISTLTDAVIKNPYIPLQVLHVGFYFGSEFLPLAANRGRVNGTAALHNESNQSDHADAHRRIVAHELTTCTRPLQDIKDPRFDLLSFRNGTKASYLAWQCGRNQVCCGWECCMNIPETNGFIIIAVVLACALLAVLVCCMCLTRHLRNRSHTVQCVTVRDGHAIPAQKSSKRPKKNDS